MSTSVKETTATYSQAAEVLPQRSQYILDPRDDFNPFEVPTEEELITAVRMAYLDKGCMMIWPHTKGRKRGSYQVSFSHEITDVDKRPIDINREGSKISLYLVPAEKARGNDNPREEGTLVTMLHAAHPEAEGIPNSAFDKAWGNTHDIIVPTRLQNHYGTSVANGNRFVVLKKGSVNIPSRIVVTHPTTGEQKSFYTRYKGQTWYCRTCMADHVGACAYRKRFMEVKEAREKLVIKRNIVGDSTLRYTQEAGLRANVLSMPGGNLSQITTAIMDDPKTLKAEEIVIFAGNNDIKAHQHDTKPQYMASVEAGTKKLEKLAETCPEKQFILKNTLSQDETEAVDKDLQFNMQYPDIQLERISEKNENISLIDLRGSKIDKENGHPTVEGSLNMLKELQNSLKDLIFNEEFCTTKQLYSGCKAIFRYGCNGCFTKGRYNEKGKGGFCPLCSEFYKEFKDPEAEEKCWKLVDLLFPPLPMDVESNNNEAFEMKAVNIVLRDENDDGDDQTAKKHKQDTAE